jgi:DNA (cytosine-5)-methyltransferase 1
VFGRGAGERTAVEVGAGDDMSGSLVTESFSRIGRRIVRTVVAGNLSGASWLDDEGLDLLSAPGARWTDLVRRGRRLPTTETAKAFRILDLFCGSGGLAFGAAEALGAVGMKPKVSAAIDLDDQALEIYERNLDCRHVVCADVGRLVDFHVNGRAGGARFDYAPTLLDEALKTRLVGTDLLVAGPPCQGHSNLNNRTRRDDPKNLHYLTVPAFAVALRVPVVVIENVPEVVNDSRSVVATATELLLSQGYSVRSGVLSALDFGVAQSRKRFFLIAWKDREPTFGNDLASLLRGISAEQRLVLGDVIGDLVDKEGDTELHSASNLSAENRKRIDYLFENGLWELPDAERPDCHKNGHTYKSVYGRLHWEQPAGTITTGFLTPGRGRFVHPTKRRTLTPHEAARLQGFPDSFQFYLRDGSVPSKKRLAKIIGDAVPPRLGYCATLAALAMWSTSEAAALSTRGAAPFHHAQA